MRAREIIDQTRSNEYQRSKRIPAFKIYILIRSLLTMLLIDFIHEEAVQFSFFIKTEANLIFH